MVQTSTGFEKEMKNRQKSTAEKVGKDVKELEKKAQQTAKDLKKHEAEDRKATTTRKSK